MYNRGSFYRNLVVAALLTQQFIIGSQSQGCDSTVQRSDGSTICYTMVYTSDSWDVARRQCSSRGSSSHLAAPLTPYENSAITTLLQANGLTESWLGASEAVSSWRWLNGDEVTYQGCYRDNTPNAHDFLTETFLPGTNSPQRCKSQCADGYYAYAALESGSKCRCGNSIGRYNQLHSTCSTPCPGQTTTSCGGDSSLDIYSVSGSYSNWKLHQPYNYGDLNCAVMNIEESRWLDVSCSRSGHGAVCDLGAGTAHLCSSHSLSFVTGDRCAVVIGDTSMTYFTARQQCHQLRGDLIQLKTETDNTEFSEGIRGLQDNTTISAASLPKTYWIGLARSHWSWVSRDAFVYTNWQLDQPSVSSPTEPSQCMILSRTENGRWINGECNSSRPFVCQTDLVHADKTSTRSSFPLGGAGSKASNSAGKPTTTKIGATTPAGNQSATEDEGSSSLPLPTGTFIGIICGAAGGLLLIIIVIVVVCIVCRRKRLSKTGQSKSKNKDELEAGNTENAINGDYYFGITINDLKEANELPDPNYETIPASDQPDVIPPNSPTIDMNTYTNSCELKRKAMQPDHEKSSDSENNAADNSQDVYADCISGVIVTSP